MNVRDRRDLPLPRLPLCYPTRHTGNHCFFTVWASLLRHTHASPGKDSALITCQQGPTWRVAEWVHPALGTLGVKNSVIIHDYAGLKFGSTLLTSSRCGIIHAILFTSDQPSFFASSANLAFSWMGEHVLRLESLLVDLDPAPAIWPKNDAARRCTVSW